MKKFIGLLALIVIIASCSQEKKQKETTPIKVENNASSSQLLVSYLETYGNYINSNDAPALIAASELETNLKNIQWHLIDIRTEKEFTKGHIGRAHNVSFESLPFYLDTAINADVFDHIVIIDQDGQSAGYAASLLRLMGYGNAYSLKFGMASWNKKFMNYWNDNLSSDFTHLMDTSNQTLMEKSSLPALEDGDHPGKTLEKRAYDLFSKGPEHFKIMNEELEQKIDDLFLVNYGTIAKYKSLHLKNSVLFKVRKSLQLDTDLLSLPKDKEIVVYCITGHQSAYVTAYLNLIGYHAKSLVFGLNGLAFNTLKQKEWTTFSEKHSNDFEILEGVETKELEIYIDKKPANDSTKTDSIAVKTDSLKAK